MSYHNCYLMFVWRSLNISIITILINKLFFSRAVYNQFCASCLILIANSKTCTVNICNFNYVAYSFCATKYERKKKKAISDCLSDISAWMKKCHTAQPCKD